MGFGEGGRAECSGFRGVIPAYRIFADITVIETLRGIRLVERNRIAAFFEELKTSPDHPGDFVEKGASGREYHTRIIGGWAITYWADHPALEVKIEQLIRADRP